MSFLIHAADAILEWGFYENALFTRAEADEFLRELFLYMIQHTRKQWMAYPSYRVHYNSEFHDLMTVVHNHDVYTYWQMRAWRTNQLNNQFDTLHRLLTIDVIYKGRDSTEYRGIVQYCTNCYDLSGHYYISIERLFTRAVCWQECIEKIDSISDHIDAIMETSRLHKRHLLLIRYLTRESHQCSDPVHIKAMRNKITLLWSDIQNTPYPGPPVSADHLE